MLMNHATADTTISFYLFTNDANTVFFFLTEVDFDSIARDRKRSLNYMEMLTSPYQQIPKHIVRQQIGIFSSLTLC